MWIAPCGSKRSKVVEFETSRHWRQVGESVGAEDSLEKVDVEFWMSCKRLVGELHEAGSYKMGNQQNLSKKLD